LLYADGDLIGNPALGIVDNLRPVADRRPADLAPGDDRVRVFYLELYGGKIGGQANQYSSEYKILKQLIGSGGDFAAAQDALRRDPSISEADWPAALEVFKHHKSYLDES